MRGPELSTDPISLVPTRVSHIGIWHPSVSGAILQYEPIADLRYTVLDGSNRIQQFLDVSGAGNHGQVQGTGGARPLQTNTSTITGGRPAARFDGLATFLRTSAISLAPPVTIFVVAGNSAASQLNRIAIDGQATDSREILWGSNTTTMQMLWTTVSNGTQGINSTTTLGPTGALFSMLFDSTSSIYHVDGANKTGVLAGTGNGSSGLTIGARFNQTLFWQGDMGLLLIYGRVLSGSEIAQVEGDILSRWPGLY